MGAPGGSLEGPGGPWGRFLEVLGGSWSGPGGSHDVRGGSCRGSWGGPGRILESSLGSWGTPNTHICGEFVRFSVCLEQVHFFVFFFVPLHSECFWKHFKSLFGPKAGLGMVRGGLWGKECAPKSFQWPVRDRKSSILNRGDFPGIAPELIKIYVLVIGVLFETVKPEI